MFRKILPLLFLFITTLALAQEEIKAPLISYSGTPKLYEIGDIQVVGVENYDPKILVNLSGLKVGSSINIPGDEISNAIRNYWNHGLFSNDGPVESKYIDRVVSLKRGNSKITKKEIKDLLDKENIKVSDKAIELILNVYFYEFEK